MSGLSKAGMRHVGHDGAEGFDGCFFGSKFGLAEGLQAQIYLGTITRRNKAGGIASLR